MGQDVSDGMWHRQISPDIRSEVSCDDRDLLKEDLEDPREYVFDKKHWKLLASQEVALSLSVKGGFSLVSI